jgi:hypothetical protein
MVVAAAAIGCVPEIPEGTLPCDSDPECPRGWHCWPSDQRCHSDPSDARPPEEAIPDGSLRDAMTGVRPMDAAPDATIDAHVGPDAATGVDASWDGGLTVDSGPTSPTVSPLCERIEADGSSAIFVALAPVGSMANDCGSRDHPCASIALGIEQAQVANYSHVYINVGTYEEQVMMRAGVSLVGGWNKIGGTWRSNCVEPEKLATIRSPTNVGVWAEYEGTSRLERLTIASKATADAGETLYGVFARGATTRLELRQVRIEAAKGGDGAEPAAGVAPAAPTMTCAAGSGLAAIGMGEPGQPAATGTYDMDGYHVATAQPGQAGPPGNHATARAPLCRQCVESGSCATTSGICSGTVAPGESCAEAGAPGCGGLGGPGGLGGQGGGASVGLFAWGARIELHQSVLVASDGGTGARGGEGSPGGPGAAGAAGTPGAACPVCVSGRRIFEPGPVFPIDPTPVPFAAGAARGTAAGDARPGLPNEQIVPILPPLLLCSEASGTAAISGSSGTPGAAGGRGGDGAGGPSYSLFGGGGAVLRNVDSELQHGQGGMSSGEGAPGAAAPIGDDGTAMRLE